jgi:hypothetical protein
MQSHRSLYWFNNRFPFFDFGLCHLVSTSNDQFVLDLTLRLSGLSNKIHGILNYRFVLFYCITRVPFDGANHSITRTLSMVQFKVMP